MIMRMEKYHLEKRLICYVLKQRPAPFNGNKANGRLRHFLPIRWKFFLQAFSKVTPWLRTNAKNTSGRVPSKSICLSEGTQMEYSLFPHPELERASGDTEDHKGFVIKGDRQ